MSPAGLLPGCVGAEEFGQGSQALSKCWGLREIRAPVVLTVFQSTQGWAEGVAGLLCHSINVLLFGGVGGVGAA